MKNKRTRNIPHTAYLLAALAVAFLCAASAPAQRAKRAPRPQTARVEITANGYEPGSLTLRRGVPARLTFTRRTDATCATEIVIPAYGINRPLPLGEPVVVAFTPSKSGEFTFTCGMNMMRGRLVVR